MGRTSLDVDDAEGDLDFNKDFRGFPLDRRIGSEEPRESVGRRGEVDAGNCGVSSSVGDSGEDLGKSTVPVDVGSPLSGVDWPLASARSS